MAVARAATPIVALDVPTSADAVRLVEQLGRACDFYKVGSELFAAAGPAILDYLRSHGARIFLDLKLHDIPNTVERAACVAAQQGVDLITVHAVGGEEMLRAAVKGAKAGGAGTGVLAVTVLTSLDAPRLGATWGRRVASVEKEVLRLAALAHEARVTGLVCSGAELVRLRGEFGNRLKLLVPGVRPASSTRGDQVRVVTPGFAAGAGADYVVLGRAVTQAMDPPKALEAIVTEMRAAAAEKGN